MMDQPEFLQVPEVDGVVWNYSMRRDMQEIVPRLFLGPYSAAMKSKCDLLVTNKITHIVCIRQAVEAHFIRPNFPEIFRYLVLDVADTSTENIIKHFPEVKKFLEECWIRGGNALIHGNAGISRSAALVIAYIMETYGLTYRDAFLLVQQKRFCICPNEGFTQQLMEYEPIYQAKKTFQNGQTSQLTGQLKRRIDEVDRDDESCPVMETMDCSDIVDRSCCT